MSFCVVIPDFQVLTFFLDLKFLTTYFPTFMSELTEDLKIRRAPLLNPDSDKFGLISDFFLLVVGKEFAKSLVSTFQPKLKVKS